MRNHIAIVYNRPQPSRYDKTHEVKALLGVLPCVTAVHRALIELGYSVNIIPLSPPYEKVKTTLNSLKVNLVFNLFEGFPGEPQTEAIVPEILSEMGLPYTGCSSSVLRTALDKARVKRMLLAARIPTPDFQLLSPQKINTFRLKYPCIVKPMGEDASHGITAESVVHDFSSLEKRVRIISDLYDEQALVEDFIDGREFNVSIIGNSHCTVLPISEIIFSLPPEMPAILTFDAKWEPDSIYYKETKAVCPAVITRQEQISIRETATAAFHLVGCSGYARVDMRLDKKGRFNVIEVNPNPDISLESGTVRQAAAVGMKYIQFIEKIVKLARDRKKDDHKNKTRIDIGQRVTTPITRKHARV